MSQDITIHLTDRDGEVHKLIAPIDMQMNLMEICKTYELPVEGTCGGMAMCASCQCYIESDQPEETIFKFYLIVSWKNINVPYLI